MLTVVPGDGSGHESGKGGSPSLIDEIVREGARRMLAEALQAEVDAYIAQFTAERDENEFWQETYLYSRAASVYGSPVAAIRARIACLRSLFCVMAVSFRRRSHALPPGHQQPGQRMPIGARESPGPLSSSPPAAWAPVSSEAGRHALPLPAP